MESSSNNYNYYEEITWRNSSDWNNYYGYTGLVSHAMKMAKGNVSQDLVKDGLKEDGQVEQQLGAHQQLHQG